MVHNNFVQFTIQYCLTLSETYIFDLQKYGTPKFIHPGKKVLIDIFQKGRRVWLNPTETAYTRHTPRE